MTQETWPAQWRRALLTTAILGAIGAGSTYGYAISQHLERLGWGAVAGGVLYPALRALESDGLVTSRWEPQDTGPARRLYDLTQTGREEIRRLGTTWPRFAGVLTDLLHDKEGSP